MPKGIPPIATVLPAVGVVPLAVPPPDQEPQQIEQLQYAVSVNSPKYVPALSSEDAPVSASAGCEGSGSADVSGAVVS